MSKRNRVKNPCRICNQTVANKSGVQCKGACARWAHYKCLGYSPQKILDIRDGVIKITCPCPNCTPKVPVEVEGGTIRQFFPGRLGDAPCSPDAPCHLSGQPDHPPAGPPPKITPPSKPIPQMEESPCVAAGKMSPCVVEVPCEPAQYSIPARQLPPRKQYLLQPYIRKSTDCQRIHGKPPCQKPGELEAPCQPVEEASQFPRASPKRSFIKPKDEFAFNPTSLEPQLFQPAAFKSDPPPCNLDTCKPLCLVVPPQEVTACDEDKCRTPSPKCPISVVCRPSPRSPGQAVTKKYKDCKTPPLSKTPSKISLVSPKGSPNLSKEACPIPCKTPSVPASPQKSPSTSASQQKSPSGSGTSGSSSSGSSSSDSHTPTCETATSPVAGLFSKLTDKLHKLISPPASLTIVPQCPASTMTSFANRLPCKKSAPCQAAPPYTSLSCCKTCIKCKCSSNESKSNCTSSICPKRALTKTPPKAPPSTPCAQQTLCMGCTSSIIPQKDVPTSPARSGVTSSEDKSCMDCTSSICPQNCTGKLPPKTRAACPEKKSCVDCTSSICPNRHPSLRAAQTSTEKKCQSCASLTVFRESQPRPAISDSNIANACQTTLFSAIDRLCTTVGQLSGQIKLLMSKMRLNS